jgi:hypothetical protein
LWRWIGEEDPALKLEPIMDRLPLAIATQPRDRVYTDDEVRICRSKPRDWVGSWQCVRLFFVGWSH